VKFKYHKLNLSPQSDFFGKFIVKPIIPIKISTSDTSLKYAALIDSGADFCIFDAQIGEYLGLTIRRGTEVKFGGIQNMGFARAYLHKISIEIGGHEFRIEAGFSYDTSKDGYGILGQKGFFNLFSIKFDLAKEEIELKPR